MLTTDELEGMREAAEEWLTDTCAIQTSAEVDDGMGGATRSWTVVAGYEAVPCRWTEVVSGSERQVAAAITSGVAVVLEVPWDTPLTARQRIVHQDGTTVQIESVLRPQTNPITLRAVCRTVL